MAREITVSACQYVINEITIFTDFANKVRAFLDKSKGSDLVIFPELFTIELFTTLKNWRQQPISELVLIEQFTADYKELFHQEAKKRRQFIVSGSHLEMVTPGHYENIAHIWGPDDEHYCHTKTHIFPAESDWFTQEGEKMTVFQLPFGTVGFNICYETEIPECASSLAEQGVELILTPSATFTEQGFWRVRHCAQSRCIENQVYLVHCCLGGQTGGPLPNGWARSSLLGPCDLPWENPAGIIAEAPTNQPAVITGKINLDLLYENRERGAATTFKDRRRKSKLYRLWPSHI
ncbi:amidohydrolase [Salmonella enterica]|uniref:nitrilase-related carbon-nitrogen hydrolase n=1 Tax=Salmonella enterica TaxID=28901 RepID=UPI0012DDB6E6|nr:nitrilase-related carbon-nitrogen hydrolase [Salmonella enterica]QGR34828.1 amidohydrolase [Salmonella enterica]